MHFHWKENFPSIHPLSQTTIHATLNLTKASNFKSFFKLKGKQKHSWRCNYHEHTVCVETIFPTRCVTVLHFWPENKNKSSGWKILSSCQNPTEKKRNLVGGWKRSLRNARKCFVHHRKATPASGQPPVAARSSPVQPQLEPSPHPTIPKINRTEYRVLLSFPMMANRQQGQLDAMDRNHKRKCADGHQSPEGFFSRLGTDQNQKHRNVLVKVNSFSTEIYSAPVWKEQTYCKGRKLTSLWGARVPGLRVRAVRVHVLCLVRAALMPVVTVVVVIVMHSTVELHILEKACNRGVKQVNQVNRSTWRSFRFRQSNAFLWGQTPRFSKNWIRCWIRFIVSSELQMMSKPRRKNA